MVWTKDLNKIINTLLLTMKYLLIFLNLFKFFFSFLKREYLLSKEKRKTFKIIIFLPVTSPPPVGDPCTPSPCGLYAECRAIGDQAACSCLKNYIGLPPNCRPECVVNTDCPSNQACISEKCRDPCIGSCGQNADCRVQNHIPVCLCQPGYTGDPFTLCSQIIGIY